MFEFNQMFKRLLQPAAVSIALIAAAYAPTAGLADEPTSPDAKSTAGDHRSHDHDMKSGEHGMMGMMGKEHHSENKAGDAAEKKIRRSQSYLLNACPVGGEEFAGTDTPVIYEHEGREIRFCCKDCVAKFKADPAKYLKKIDDQIIAQQKENYPLDTCPVSGEKLGQMGDPVDYVYKNRLVRFYCKGCVSQFEKDPDKYLAKLDQAIVEKQSDNYPLKTCVVSGDELGQMGAEPINYVYGTQLVKFCCPACIKDFEKNPQVYLKKIQEARGGSAEKNRAENTEAGRNPDSDTEKNPAHEPHNENSEGHGAHQHHEHSSH
ncbi:MAG: hypothetical protein Kow0059_10130 [Candidatus Sumerlaeia bacterium]